jgi:hypothetical protein
LTLTPNSNGFGENSVPSPKAAIVEAGTKKGGHAAASTVAFEAQPMSPTALQVDAAHKRLRNELCSSHAASPVGEVLLRVFQRLGADASISDVAQAIVRAQAPHPGPK